MTNCSPKHQAQRPESKHTHPSVLLAEVAPPTGGQRGSDTLKLHETGQVLQDPKLTMIIKNVV